MIFVCGNLLSGIGQVTLKYASLVGNCPVLGWEDEIPEGQDIFVFALPLPPHIEKIKHLKKISKSVKCMCVCETEKVHPIHKQLFDLFEKVAVPSEFCKKIFSKQFPNCEFKVIHHWVPQPNSLVKTTPTSFTILRGTYDYIFYHIGNITDHRKQIKKIIETFYRLQLPNALLVLKATCIRPVEMKLPNVMVINGLVSPDEIRYIHSMCDCYVSFSHSEGVGMGAVEAALNNKPVIITEYGGAPEYIQTPYTIKCGRCKVGVDDFLYTKDMEWGDPDQEQLGKFMKEVYEKKLSYVNHDHTHNLMANVKKKFFYNISELI